MKFSRRPAKRSKYGAQPTVVDGIRFASKKEARRWQELRLLEKAGEIRDLERQVRFHIIVAGEPICTYVCDFKYWKVSKGTSWDYRNPVIEDCKGYKTPEYKLKKKLMFAIYGIEVKET